MIRTAGHHGLHSVVAAAESRIGARPVNVGRAGLLLDGCRSDRVPFCFKQSGWRTSEASGREVDRATWEEVTETEWALDEDDSHGTT